MSDAPERIWLHVSRGFAERVSDKETEYLRADIAAAREAELVAEWNRLNEFWKAREAVWSEAIRKSETSILNSEIRAAIAEAKTGDRGMSGGEVCAMVNRIVAAAQEVAEDLIAEVDARAPGDHPVSIRKRDRDTQAARELLVLVSVLKGRVS